MIWMYTNDGIWTPTLIAQLAGAVNDLELADVTGDGKPDITAVTSAGELRIYTNDGTGKFGTVVLTDYEMASQTAVQGNVTGSYTALNSSNDVYQSIREVTGVGQQVALYTAIGEIAPAYGQIASGSYLNTQSQDGAPYEVLREDFYDALFGTDRYLIRNSTAGAAPGWQYPVGTVPSLSGSDSAILTVTAFLSTGTEGMEVRYKVGSGGTPSAVLGTFTETSLTTKSFNLSGFSGGELYIVIQDSDISANDGSSDAMQTEITIDYVGVVVTKNSGNTSRLEHQWRAATLGTGGTAYRIFAEGYHTANTEGDDFNIEWASASTGPWSKLVTLTATVDDHVLKSAVIPVTLAGTAPYFRVVDANRTNGSLVNDTVSIDRLFVRRYVTIPTVTNVSLGGNARSVATGDMDNNGRRDIVAAVDNNAVIYYGPSWGTTRTLSAGNTVLRVDVFEYNGDANLDVIAAVNPSKIYAWQNGGSWNRTELADTNAANYGVPADLVAGDVDGDGFDDYMICTQSSTIVYYRHVGAQTWAQTVVEDLGRRRWGWNTATPILGIDLGDVDRGTIDDY
jgi:hypothetical protein